LRTAKSVINLKTRHRPEGTTYGDSGRFLGNPKAGASAARVPGYFQLGRLHDLARNQSQFWFGVAGAYWLLWWTDAFAALLAKELFDRAIL